MDFNLSSLLALYDDSASLAEAHTIPAPWYLEPAIERLEQQYVFGGNWQLIGRVDQVSNPGDFFTTELAGEPILAVRGAESIVELQAWLGHAEVRTTMRYTHYREQQDAAARLARAFQTDSPVAAPDSSPASNR